MRSAQTLVLGLVLTLALPASAATKKQLEQQVAELQATVATQQRQLAELAARVEALDGQEAEAKAEEALRAVLQTDPDDKEAMIAGLIGVAVQYPNTRPGQFAQRMATELAVIGIDAELEVSRWLHNGEGVIDPERTTVLVFFEEWCPHCRREVPRIQGQLADWNERGIDVIGVTALSGQSTEQDMADFVAGAEISFPVALDDGTVAEHYSVSGIPSAAVVRGGVVVWRGHPAELDDGTLSELMSVE